MHEFQQKRTRNVTENCQQDVDEEISIATSLEEDTHRWDEDGKDDLDDVAVDRVLAVCATRE